MTSTKNRLGKCEGSSAGTGKSQSKAPDPEAGGDYFDREYFVFHEGKKKYFGAIIRILRNHMPRDARRILDVGSGYGFLLHLLEERGFETYGIEQSAKAAERSRSTCRGTVSVQDAQKAFPFPSSHFDAIVMNDIVEHLADYRSCLSEVFRTLVEGGVLFVQTANGYSVARLLLGKKWFWYCDPTHVHIFNPRTLQSALRGQGFEILRSKAFFNFCQVGETTKWLKPLRRIGRMTPFPFFGDSFYILARKPQVCPKTMRKETGPRRDEAGRAKF
ncbi:MAG TPA: class I SAM-dependent methyltransferase [bacterium]